MGSLKYRNVENLTIMTQIYKEQEDTYCLGMRGLCTKMKQSLIHNDKYG